MGGVTMPLGESELQQIGDYVRGNLSDWLLDASPQVVTGRDLLQSQVRLQQELKHLRETMETRFTAQQELMEARFAAVDQRFEAQQELMEARFAAVDRRFEAVDQRFESVQETMKAGFAAVEKQFSMVKWMGLAAFAVLGILVSVLGLLAAV
jgi:glutathione S-transferase